MSDTGTVETATTETTQIDTSWMDSLDDGLKGYAATKGLHKLALPDAFKKVAEFHQNAESRLGIPADRVLKMPAADSPQAEWDAFYTRQGRPATAVEYSFEGAEDANKESVEILRNFAFAEGLSKEKGEKLWKTLVEIGGKLETSRADAAKATLTNEHAELEKSWGKGSEFQAKKLVAMRAAAAAGITEEEFEARAATPGFAKEWNRYLFFGQKMQEDKFIPGGLQQSNVYTREQALAEIKYYKDPNSDKGKAMKANNPETWANYRALLRIAYPDEKAA